MAQPPSPHSRRASNEPWYAELEQLVQRYEQGDIGDDEFSSEKQRILHQSRSEGAQLEDLQVVVAVYDGEPEARAVYNSLLRMKHSDLGHVVDALGLRRDAAGVIQITEYDGPSPRTGLKHGALIDALAGLSFPLTTFAGMDTGAAGALINYLTELGFDDRELRVLGSTLKAGQSAIYMVAQTRWDGELASCLRFAASISTYPLPEEIVALLTASTDDERTDTGP